MKKLCNSVFIINNLTWEQILYYLYKLIRIQLKSTISSHERQNEQKLTKIVK